MLIIITYYFISISFLILYYKKFFITPVFIFVIMQLFIFNGILLSSEFDNYYVNKLINIYFIALLFFLFGVFFIIIIVKIKNKRFKKNIIKAINHIEPTRYQIMVIFLLIGLSIIICLWFFLKAGINIFLESIFNFYLSEIVVYSSERKDFIDIPGTGYVYQFRCIILPILNLFLIIGQENKKYKKIGLFLLPLTITFLLGTGQRNAFVFMMLLSLLYIYNLKKDFKLHTNKLSILILVLMAIFILAVLTISNGRVSGESENIIVGALASLVDRIIGVNSRSALNAFMYIETQPTVWGNDWLMMLTDILPGKSGYISVDSITYYMIYGTFRGTEPPCIWGSAWYNWSWFGVIIFPFLLGLIYHGIYIGYKNKVKTKFHVLFYSALSTYLGLWFFDSPMVLFNNGVVTVIIMKVILFFRPIKIKKNKYLGRQGSKTLVK